MKDTILKGTVAGLIVVCIMLGYCIKDLQAKTDYLFDEVYEQGEILYELKGGAR